MVDLWGPGAFGAANSAAVRPAYTPSNLPGEADTHYQDCSSPAEDDGTEWRSAALNKMLALLRSLSRKSRLADDNLDDHLLTRAVRSQYLNFVTAGGTANGLTASLDPAPVVGEIVNGFILRLLVSTTNTGPATLSLNGAAAVAIKATGGVDLGAGDLAAGTMVTLIYLGGQWVFDSDVITTAVTKTVYGASPDFPTLVEAFEWLSRRRIAQSGSVTLNLRAGKFTHSGAGQSINFAHPDGARIVVNGAALLTAFPVNAAFAATGPSSGQRATDKASNLTLLRTVFATEINLTGGATATFRGAFASVSNILFTGDGTAVDGPAFINGSGTLTAIVGHGFGNRGVVLSGGGGYGVSKVVGVGNGGVGVFVDATSIGLTGQLAGYNNGSHGVSAGSGAAISNSGGTVCGNGNAGDGVLCDSSITICGASSTANSNGAHGFHGISAIKLDAKACTASANTAGVAFLGSDRSFVDAQNSGGTGNSAGYIASNGSTVNSTGGGATGTTPYSPALNTVGNGNSIIIG